MTLSSVSYPTDRIEAVTAKLRELPEALTQVASSEGKRPTLEDHRIIAEALFHRAPDDFIQRTPVADLAKITYETAAFYHRFASGSAPFQITVSNSDLTEAHTSIFTAIIDRPFVVDSLTEYFRARNIRHHVLIHPIIKDEVNGSNRLISLAYAEIDRIEDEAQIASLRADLEQIFNDLLLVTDHFPKIVESMKQLIASKQVSSQKDDPVVAELATWLLDGNFVFLGCRTSSPEPVGSKDLGLFCTANRETQAALNEARLEIEHLSTSHHPFLFSQLSIQSPIHRRNQIEKLTFRAGENSFFSVIGLLTSRANNEACSSVPVVREKLQSILDEEGLPPTSHDYKELVTYANSLPKSFLFQVETAALKRLLQAMVGIQRRNETRITIHTGPLKRLASVVVALPRSRASREVTEKIQHFLEEEFHLPHNTAHSQLKIVEDLLATLFFILPHPERLPSDTDRLEKTISELSKTWREEFRTLIIARHGRTKASALIEKYEADLSPEYQSTTTPLQAVQDVQILESLQPSSPLAISLNHSEGGDIHHHLRIYKLGKNLPLSSLTPFVENAGFEILSESLANIRRKREEFAAIHDLQVRPRAGALESDAEHTAQIVRGITAVFNGTCENDRLNALLLSPGLTVEQIALVRTVHRYLWQIKAFPSEASISTPLIENPQITKLLVDYFFARFDPALGGPASKERTEKMSQVNSHFQGALKEVSVLAHDRVLRAAWNVIESTVRTNFFRTNSLRVALKINCQAILKLPRPRPYFEIFVCAPTFEGVHLRGGKVARGGLRWSERPEDFRTEVLGLMKTQMVKNSIIVPVGAKGGFVLKGGDGKAPARETVVERYREFIRSLLEVTDNRVGHEIVPPVNVVSHDPLDPYLVVAADKGTADLSDVANEIATKEFGFWLGDAFASGGSYGYSHKKYGITARGAWETTLRHFRSLNKDIEKNTFTVVGIGDMSGDVFGNGLLLSRKALLVAAFDHRGIFLDPTPDAEISFKERERLFQLPRSSWSDYKKELITAGGGVFPRDAKEIAIGKEVSAALDIPEGVYSGQEVIRAILKAPVDLIWNGGIGTYIKATSEENINVSDRANDEVRIDATEVRAKIVGEGGNLGVTQLGRVEYALRGGHIYTDAVDNSGGVNLSDLEVNLKILFSEALRNGELSFEKRNEILLQYVDDVCERVLVRNRAQSLIIDLDLHRSRSKISIFQHLVSSLERSGLLDRNGENLPNEETLNRRAQTKSGLTRPELAVLTSYAKMFVFQAVLNSSLADDPFLTQYLIRYFPQGISLSFESAVLAHPLRREIIATQVANILVERMGSAFVHRMISESDASAERVIRAFVIADSVLGAAEITAHLAKYDQPGKQSEFCGALIKLSSSLDRMTRWFLEHQTPGTSISATAEQYAAALRSLLPQTAELLPTTDRRQFEAAVKSATEGGFSLEDASALALTQYAGSYLDVIQIAETTKLPVIDVAKLFGEVSGELHISSILQLSGRIVSSDQWELSALRTLNSEIRSGMGRIVRFIIEKSGSADTAALKHYQSSHAQALERFRLTINQMSEGIISVSALFVLTKQLQTLSR